MSRSLRYTHPIVCNYLASQYVVGVMSPRVRARMGALRLTVPELEAAIISWSDEFAPIHDRLPEKAPQYETWRKIEIQIFKDSTQNPSASRFWQSIRFWQFTGLSTSMASLALAVMLFVFPPQPKTLAPLASSPPSYLAIMSPAANNTDIRFVVNLYQKTEQTPPRLFIQWSADQPRSDKTAMHLWAKDKQTGRLTYIGVEPSGVVIWDLQTAMWQAVSSSSTLYFTNTNDQPSVQNTLFSGPCIPLGSWKQSAI